MLKLFTTFFMLALITLGLNTATASTKKKKKKSRSHKVSKSIRHSRKSRNYHRGTGPDLKTITTDSPYKEDPNNGVNPIETKQPGQ